MVPRLGYFYEFHKDRAISRPGQPLDTRVGLEIGPPITGEDAFRQAKTGKDVYTFAREDAYKLALQLNPGKPIPEGPHAPPKPSTTGREDVYFRHFHPGGLHDRFGHIFFGQRGENYPPAR